MLEQFRQRILDASASGTPLQISGSGSKHWYGQAPQGELLDTRGYTGIVDYDPAELVITVRCGTPLAEIEAVLAERRQMLAFEPPHFGPGATFGGCIAAGLSGPRRQGGGAMRDFMLGVVMMDGRGQELTFGGQVMKNVAGYDVARLLAGSLGTLGLILEASVKVMPLPFAETTLRFSYDEATALNQLNSWGGLPMPLAGSVWQDGVLHLRLSGAEAAVKSACQRLGGERLDDAAALWLSLREQNHAFFAPALNQSASLWRLAVPTTAPALSLPGTQLIEWGGGQRWWLTDAPAATVRAAAQAVGGHATLFRNGSKPDGVFTPLPAPMLAIHKNLKQSFDPAGIFNPGRMYLDL